MVIRGLRKSDFAMLVELIKEVYLENPKSMWFKYEPSDGILQYILEEKLRMIEEKRCIDSVATEGNDIVGECEVSAMGEGYAKIGIIIKKEYRNRGLGGELVDYSIYKAGKIGIKSIGADVHIENKTALGFFKSIGFKKVQNKNGEDAGKLVYLEKDIR